MTDEEWLPVREFPDHYEVSSLGRVRNVGTYHRSFTGKIRKPYVARNGYPTYSLSINSRYQMRLAHRLVADAFLGPIPEGMQVNHKDGNKANCRVDNLEIVTNGENRAHSYRVLGVKPNGLKITPAQRKEIRDLYETSRFSQNELADRYGVSQNVIYRIVKCGKPHSKANFGEKNGSSNLTESDVRQIRQLYQSGLTQRQVGDRFGVSQRTVSLIIRRETWAHIE